jgi:hypothetical protein
VETFIIERSLGFSGDFKEIANPPGDVRTYEDTTVATATQYTYRIKARGNTGYDTVYSEVKQAITWSVYGADNGDPKSTQYKFFANPTIGHTYQITATVSSTEVLETGSLQSDSWWYDTDDVSAFARLAGGEQITNPSSSFKNFNFGQLVIKVNESDWFSFTSNDVQTETPLPCTTAEKSTAWECAMADDTDWSDNWGSCLIQVLDVTE